MIAGFATFFERLERLQGPWIGAASLVLAPAVAMAMAKPLWFDELLTLNIAGLARLSEIPAALADGADVQPLLGYVLARASLGLLGESPFAVRLPALVGFAVACWVVFRFTSQRAGAAAGAAATLFLGLTEAFTLSYEARPYGLLLAFTALALLSWTEICQGRNRKTALLGLCLSLAAGLASHYYAVLIFVPIAAGELARTRRRRRADLAVWGAMAAASAALAAHLPLIQAARRIYSGGFWSPVEPSDVVGSYIYLLARAFLPAVSVLIVWILTTKPASGTRNDGPLLFEESAALAALAALPLVAVPLALIVTKAYVYRYASPALIAGSILFGLATERIAAGRRGVIAATALVLLGWFGATRAVLAAPPEDPAAQLVAVENLAARMALPVVVTSPLLYLQDQHYSPSELAGRLVYLSDPNWALGELGTDSADRNLTRLRRWAPLRVEDYSPFLAANPAFLLSHRPGARFEWITGRLEAEGKHLRKVGSAGSLQLLRCCE